MARFTKRKETTFGAYQFWMMHNLLIKELWEDNNIILVCGYYYQKKSM